MESPMNRAVALESLASTVLMVSAALKGVAPGDSYAGRITCGRLGQPLRMWIEEFGDPVIGPDRLTWAMDDGELTVVTGSTLENSSGPACPLIVTDIERIWDEGRQPSAATAREVALSFLPEGAEIVEHREGADDVDHWRSGEPGDTSTGHLTAIADDQVAIPVLRIGIGAFRH